MEPPMELKLSADDHHHSKACYQHPSLAGYGCPHWDATLYKKVTEKKLIIKVESRGYR